MCEMVAEMRGERNNADANIEDDDDDNEIVPPRVITIAQAMQMTEQLKVFASCKGLDFVYQNAASIESELVARKLTPTCCMQTTMDMCVAVQHVE